MPYAITWIENGFLYIIAPYNKDFLDELNLAIPKIYKRWDIQGRVWLIHELYKSEAVKIVEKYFILKKINTNNSYELMLKDLTKEGLKSVWRQVALRLHPDKGGSHDSFIKAQAAYERLMEYTKV